MKPFLLSSRYAAPLALVFLCAPMGAQERNPFDALPNRDTQQLQQLLDLDDTRFGQLVQENNGARFRSIVSAFDPPGTAVFPVSHGFAGVKQACLAARAAVACRLYISDLLAVQRERQDAAAVSNNPFASR